MFVCYRNSETETGVSLQFRKLVVEGGGKLTVESTGHGSVTLEGEEVDVQSGGIVEADVVTFKVKTFTVRQAALIKCSYKVCRP